MSNFVLEGHVPKVVRSISIPITTGFFFHTMFNVTDTYFAGHFSTEALAGMSVSFPLFFVLISLGAGFGGGITSLISTELGRGDKRRAAYIHIQGLVLMALISLLMALFGEALLEPSLKLLGAEGQYYQHALDYMLVTYQFGFALLMSQVINAPMISMGKSSYYRNTLIGGFFANLALDPIFMYGMFGMPQMGIAGVALSTALVNFAGALYLVWKLKQTGFWKDVAPADFIPDLKTFLSIKYQGIPAFLNMFLITVFFFMVNFFLSRYGLQPVAAFGIGLRIEQIALIPCIGVNMACVAVIAQSKGAGNIQRIFESYAYSMKLTLMLIAPLCILVFLLRTPLMALFSSDAEVVEIGALYLSFAAVFTVANSIVNINHALFQGLKKPHLALFNGIFRHMILPMLLLNAVTGVWGLGLDWFWGMMTITSFSGFLISSVMAFYMLRNLRRTEASPAVT